MRSCAFSSHRLFKTCRVDCLIVSHWTELGSAPSTSVTQHWQGWHDTHVSNPGIWICMLPQICREKHGRLWQITSWLLRLSLCIPNCIFPLHPIPTYSLKKFCSHTVCLHHWLSGSLFVHVHFWVPPLPYLWTFCSLALPAKSRLPANLTAIDWTTEMSFLSPRNSRGFGCPKGWAAPSCR